MTCLPREMLTRSIAKLYPWHSVSLTADTQAILETQGSRRSSPWRQASPSRRSAPHAISRLRQQTAQRSSAGELTGAAAQAPGRLVASPAVSQRSSASTHKGLPMMSRMRSAVRFAWSNNQTPRRPTRIVAQARHDAHALGYPPVEYLPMAMGTDRIVAEQRELQCLAQYAGFLARNSECAALAAAAAASVRADSMSARQQQTFWSSS